MLSQYGGPPRGFGEQGTQGIYFRGTGEQRPNFEGNRGTKTILGNREHKSNFRFLGNKPIYFRGNRYPPPLGGPHYEQLHARLFSSMRVLLHAYLVGSIICLSLRLHALPLCALGHNNVSDVCAGSICPDETVHFRPRLF